MSPAWQATWDWLNGQQAAPAPYQAHVEELGADDEAIGINAGYALGCDTANVASLLEALDSNPDPHENERRYSDNGQIWREDAVVRNAAHGLVRTGETAMPGLLDVLGAGTARGRKHAAFALGEMCTTAAHPALCDALGDDDVHVRIAAAEALGASRRLAATPEMPC